jgi:hypothetical protein
MLEVKWTDKTQIEGVYRRIEERPLWNNKRKRRTRCIGHTLSHSGFVKSMIKRYI